MSERYLAAAIQCEPLLGRKDENTERLLALIEQAARAGARVIVLPEMATTGYCWRDRAEIAPFVESVPGPTTEAFGALARRHACYIAVGLAELDPATSLYYNSAVLLGPTGLLACYRKSHAFISEPRWAAESVNQPPVVATPFGRLGLLICMDADYVEPARLLGVAGCDVVLFPTCWVDEKAPSAVWMTRAYENGMYLVAADRYGRERGVQFSGGSCILDPDGAVVAMQDTGDGIVYGQIDLTRTQRRPFVPGLPGDKMADRRPSGYAALALHGYLWNPLDFHALYDAPGLARGGTLRVAVVQTAGQAPEIHAHEPVTPEVPGPAAQTAKDMYMHASARVDEVRRLALRAATDGARLIVLPALPLLLEMPASAAEADAGAEGLDGPTVQWLIALARETRGYLVGSLIERDGARLYLTVVLVDGSRLIGSYRALHLSGFARAWAAPGDRALPIFDLPTARVGLLYGDDTLLPEPARLLALAGADLICVPAALTGPPPRGLPASAVPFPDARLAAANPRHFDLWRQRALENNTFVAFANRGAPDGMGESGVFGPEFGADAATVERDGVGIATLDVDTTSLSERFPTAPVRVKEMLRRRVPAMYVPLVMGAK